MKVPPPETGLPTAELDTETYTVTVPAGAEVPGCEEPPAEELELEEPDELEEAPEEEELDPEPALEDEEDPEPESEDPLESELSDEDPSPFDFDSSLPEASLDASFLSSDSLLTASVSFESSPLPAFASSAPLADEASTSAERTIPTLSAALTTGESAGRPKPFVKANAEAPMNSTDTTARAAMPTRVAKESDVRFDAEPERAVWDEEDEDGDPTVRAAASAESRRGAFPAVIFASSEVGFISSDMLRYSSPSRLRRAMTNHTIAAARPATPTAKTM